MYKTLFCYPKIGDCCSTIPVSTMKGKSSQMTIPYALYLLSHGFNSLLDTTKHFQSVKLPLKLVSWNLKLILFVFTAFFETKNVIPLTKDQFHYSLKQAKIKVIDSLA